MQDDNKRKESESHRKSVLKYKRENYKKLTIEAKIQYIDKIKGYCQDIGLSQADFIIRCCNYFIDNKEVPPE